MSAAVTFAVTAGGGSLTGASATTSAAGIATVAANADVSITAQLADQQGNPLSAPGISATGRATVVGGSFAASP